MDPQTISILAATAFVTSTISAIVGMAGGIVLLSVMLLFLEPLVAIPIHGAIQFVSNSTRSWVQREHVRWSIISWYCLLLIPMSFVGLQIAQELSPPTARFLIGAFVLVATWSPSLLLMGAHPESTDPRRRFLILGGVVGAINMTVGATGPLLAPFFLNLGLSRRSLVGTKAVSQSLGHVVKIAVFGLAGFAFADYAWLLVTMCSMVVAGTWVGSRLLDRVSEVWFIRIFKTVLTVVALRLVIGEGLELLNG